MSNTLSEWMKLEIFLKWRYPGKWKILGSNHFFDNNNSETPKIKPGTTYWTKNTRVSGIRNRNQTYAVLSTYHSFFYRIVYVTNDTNQRPYFVRWRRHLSAAAAVLTSPERFVNSASSADGITMSASFTTILSTMQHLTSLQLAV